MPDSKRYIPSKEADTNYLKEWAKDEAGRKATVPLLTQRYIDAIGNMTAGDLSRFVAMMLILQGNSLPPFPDQQ
jgi:hypothetical protein